MQVVITDIKLSVCTCYYQKVMRSTPGRVSGYYSNGWLFADRLTMLYITNTKVNSALHPFGVSKLAGVKAGRVYVCWVTGNTVW